MNKHYDIVSIGHIDNSILNYMGKVTRFIGGAVYYSAFAAQRSGARICVVTKLAEKDKELLNDFKKEGIEVIALPSAKTTSVENIFETEDVDKRKVILLSQADPFKVEEIPEFQTTIYNLAGLFVGEIPDSMIEGLAKKAKIALDLQAMLRSSKDGVFSWQDWPEKRQYLPMITYLKADSLEAEVVTGTSDREEAAKILYQWGASEVMISHSSEVIVYNGAKIYRAPFNPSNLSGRTGRGDTVFISYMSWRLNHDIQESVSYAAALTSIKMEKPGPFLGTSKEVLGRMKAL